MSAERGEDSFSAEGNASNVNERAFNITTLLILPPGEKEQEEEEERIANR